MDFAISSIFQLIIFLLNDKKKVNEKGRKLKMDELFPYWMSLSDHLSISNSIEFHHQKDNLKNIWLLTAPNMSGKSTIMRSVLVGCLLGFSLFLSIFINFYQF